MSQLNGGVRIQQAKAFTRDPHSNQLPLVVGSNFHDDPISRSTFRKSQLLTTNNGIAHFLRTPDTRFSDGTVANASRSQLLGGSTGPYAPFDADAFIGPDSAAYTSANPVPAANAGFIRSLPPTLGPDDFASDMPHSFSPDSPTDDASAPASRATTGNVVLRFGGYSKEAVSDSATERVRVRRLIFAFYVADGTVAARLLADDNSGLEVTPFINRQRVTADSGPTSMSSGFIAPADGDVVTAVHMLPGAHLRVRGRVIIFVECDDFTRRYLADQGVIVPANVPWPTAAEGDDHSAWMAARRKDPAYGASLALPPAARADREWARTMAGGTARKPASEARLEQARLLDDKGAVDVRLAFIGVCDERNVPSGYVKRILLYIHVGDASVEMFEWFVESNGSRHGRRILARQRVLRDGSFAPVRVPGTGSDIDVADGLGPSDVSVGAEVRIHGRRVLVTDASEATRRWFKTYLGVELDPPVDVGELFPQPAEALFEPPPHNGIGSEADSLQSWRFLVPKAPKVDGARLKDHGTTRLNWLIALAPPSEQLMGPDSGVVRPADVDRRFRLTYHVADDTAEIDELPRRNSGTVPGRFLHRMKIMKQTPIEGFAKEYTMSPLVAADLKPSARLTFYNRTFILVEPDYRTSLFMRNVKPADTHRPPPGAAPPALGSEAAAMTPAEAATLVRLRAILSARFAQAAAAFRVCCGEGGASSSGVVTVQSLHAFMVGVGIDVAVVDTENILNAFDVDGDGALSLSEFASMLDPTVAQPSDINALPRLVGPDLRPINDRQALDKFHAKVVSRRFEVGEAFRVLLSVDAGHPPGRLTRTGLVRGARERLFLELSDSDGAVLVDAFFKDGEESIALQDFAVRLDNLAKPIPTHRFSFVTARQAAARHS